MPNASNAAASPRTKYGTLPCTAPSTATVAAHPASTLDSATVLSLALIVVLAVGSCNSLTYKIMYEAYGPKGAFFVSTGVNVLYVIYGGLLLYPRMYFSDSVTPAMQALPKHRFLIMGFLDSCGTFLAAMGAVYTPGSVQTLLNQTLIPITMLVSFLYLKTRFTLVQLGGAAFVLAGAGITVLPTFWEGHKGGGEGIGGRPAPSRWYANLIFFLSNVPVACSQVYKEKAFKRDRVDVLYLTQWVSVFQLLFGLGLAPLQALPGIGSAHGVPISSIPSSFRRSWQCFLQTPTSGCADQHPSPSLLLLGFCGINLTFNTAGLFVSKHGSAILNVITYAVLLPITTLLFSLHPLMGAYTEPLRATTVVGLLVVVLGFYLYQEPVLDLEKRSMAEGGEEVTAEEEEEGMKEGEWAMRVRVPSFQERVVAGLGPAVFQQSHGSQE